MNNNVIFAVDDEPVILDLYKNILGVSDNERLDFFSQLDENNNEETFDLHTFETGESYLQALKLLYEEGKRLPLCLLDMRLPGMHGLDIAKETRKIDSDISIIIITAYADYSVDELIKQLDQNVYYLHKPFRDDELYLLIVSNLKNWNTKFTNVDIKKELAIDSIEDGLWDWNILDNSVHFSTQWKLMLGYEEGEIDNSLDEWSSRVYPEDLNQAMQDINAHISGETEYYVNEHRLRCKDGSYKWILDRGKAHFDSNGVASRMIGFHTDITNRKKFEEELLGVSQKLSSELELKISNEMKLKYTNAELEKSLAEEITKRKENEKMLLQHTRQAAMGEMVSMIAHQWRQPLTAIKLSSDSVLLDLELNSLNIETLEESLESINIQVNYLSDTIDDFRNFFHPNIKKENVFFEKCIEDALKIIINNLGSHNVVVKKEYKQKTPLAIYTNELMQVFLNLFKNSLDSFIEHKTINPTIDLKVIETETQVKIEVADNGFPIPEEKITKIFEPYFTTKNAKNGTGLGLYMSKMIVEEHMNGVVSVINMADGVCFRLVFNK